MPAVTTESSVTADSVVDEAAAQTRGVLRMPHFLPRGGAESLDPASPTEFSYANYLLYDRLVTLDDIISISPVNRSEKETNS